MDDILFYRNADLSDVLRVQTAKMRAAIGDTPPERINGATDDELADHFVSKFSLEPLTIYSDRAEAEHRETKVDVSHDTFRRLIPDRSGPVMVKGDEVTIHVPFTGEPELFKLTPCTRNYNPPRGRVMPKGELAGTITMTLALPSDTNDADRFNAWIKEQLRGLQQYADWIRYDINGFNQQLPQHARDAVQARRAQLEKQGTLLQKLAIPLRQREGAPSSTPIPMPKKIVKLPPARKVEQEYGISEADYEYILKIIRQESRSFESTPATFAKLGEEELRNVVLAHLNGHFEGGATGERFRRKGKTDICIEHDNRAAFVAECKLWKGQNSFLAAVDQLLGYLTWRDTRTALIVWNIAIREFSRLQSEMRDLLRAHPRYIRMMEPNVAGEWRAAFRAEGDDAREVIVHVFLVDLHTSHKDEHHDRT